MTTLWCLLLVFSSVSKAFSPTCCSTHNHWLLEQSKKWNRGESKVTLAALELTHEDEQRPLPNQFQSAPRKVARIEKFTRFPVWPVWNGVFIWAISRLLGEELAAKVEDTIGGRVCPNFFQESDQTSPFILLVHHRHSFAAWDVLRWIQRSFFPEGFPAHPHRGFVTVTYILKGGFRHRDSLGVKQLYGAEDRHGGKHTQWLTTGGGILHEEMFDLSFENFFQPSDQELYQIWLNLPSRDKLTPPRIDLLGGSKETPCVEEIDSLGKVTKTTVIAGKYRSESSSAPIRSDLSIFHVEMERGTLWTHPIPQTHETAVLYTRRGAIDIQGTRIPPHHTAYLTTVGENLVIHAQEEGCDFLLLSGQPLREPVVAQGSMVMNYPDEINTAYQDYQLGKMGRPWSEKMSDEEWFQHVKQYPSIYKIE